MRNGIRDTRYEIREKENGTLRADKPKQELSRSRLFGRVCFEKNMAV